LKTSPTASSAETVTPILLPPTSMMEAEKTSTALAGNPDPVEGHVSSASERVVPATDQRRNAANAQEYVHEFPTGFRLVTILASLVVSYFLVLFEASVMSTVTPAITTEFNWYGSAYQFKLIEFINIKLKIFIKIGHIKKTLLTVAVCKVLEKT
jgi:hypothetical protein